jgi:CheY-like chemotaxis protein
VDDNQDGAHSLAMLLQMQGNEVHTVYDGPEAVAAISDFHPDVVLLDIGLPTLNGYETARRMRALPDSRDALIIALTGWGQEEDRRRSREAGFDHHLVKPVDLQTLETLLAGNRTSRLH